MNSPRHRRRDDQTQKTEIERIALAERDIDHMRDEQEQSEGRIMDELREMRDDIKKLPSKEMIGLMVNKQVYSAVSKQVNWKAVTAMMVALGTGIAALVRTLTG